MKDLDTVYASTLYPPKLGVEVDSTFHIVTLVGSFQESLVLGNHLVFHQTYCGSTKPGNGDCQKLKAGDN